MDLKDIKMKFQTHKRHSKARGIPFLLTLEEWYYIWEQSGKWEQRGCRKGQYVMSRYGDKGAYEIGNVFIQSHKNNSRDALIGVTTSEETKARISAAIKSIPKVTCPHCDKTGGLSNMKRWHFDNCKLKRD